MSSNKHGKHFCILPFVHVHLESSGDLSPCCINSLSMGNVNQNSLNEIWHSEEYQKLRSALLTNDYIPSCEICYSQERGKGQSLRTHSNEKFERFTNNLSNTPDAPVYFDLRFSNLCNLKCRSCEHKSSSLWFEDAKAIGLAASHQALINATVNPEALLEQISSYIPSAVEFYFAGGEPLVMEEHYKVLNMLIEQKRTDIRLVYNSNFMKVNFRGKSIFDYWRQFEDVELCISIDAINEVAGYVRKGTKFSELVSNRMQLAEIAPYVKVSCTPTVSILNIGSLQELLQFIIDYKFCAPEKVYLNILEYPLYYNIKIAPKNLKSHIRNQLLQFSAALNDHPNLQAEISKVLNYMDSADFSQHLEEFRAQTLKLDELREESYEDIFNPADPIRIIMDNKETTS